MLSDVSSAPRFLVDRVFSFVVHAEFEVGILQRIFIWIALVLSDCGKQSTLKTLPVSGIGI